MYSLFLLSGRSKENDMKKQIVILGYGPVGKATANLLTANGRGVQIAQRSRPADLAKGATFERCDILNPDDVNHTVAGASEVVLTIGFQYNGDIWRKSWPIAMANLLAACTRHDVRIVFVDNLYMYGAQDKPLREDMAMTTKGVKPTVRAEITRMWMASSVRVAALRVPDFYGPGVGLSHIGDGGFGALAKNKRAMLIMPPDTPHDFAYVPDVAPAVVSLLDADDSAYRQVWHMPCAPTRTARQILELGVTGAKPKISSLPLWLLPMIGRFVPMMREFWEMRFLLDRPYHVDAQKFKTRFWSDVTPFEVGAPATAASFR
jgi:nucleoside-diphosphate-sugar epimerase